MFEFPIEITLLEHVRKGPLPTVLEEETLPIKQLVISRKSVGNREKMREVSSVAQLWYQKRALRIGTGSRFGEIVSRKAPVNRVGSYIQQSWRLRP